MEIYDKLFWFFVAFISILWIVNGIIGIKKQRVRLIGNDLISDQSSVLSGLYEGKSAITAGLFSIVGGGSILLLICVCYLYFRGASPIYLFIAVILFIVFLLAYITIYIYLKSTRDRSSLPIKSRFRCPKCNLGCKVVRQDANNLLHREKQIGFYCKNCNTIWNEKREVITHL